MTTLIHVPDATSPIADFRTLSGEERNWRPGEITPLDKYRERLIKRFWAKVDKTPGLGPWGNCWEWRGSTDGSGGYGTFGVSKNHALALGLKNHIPVQRTHTVAWVVLYSHDIPTGHEMCHKCNNKPCVREDHLFTGTHLANIRHAQTTGVMRRAKPKPEPEDYLIRLLPVQYEMLRASRRSQKVSIVDVAHMAQMHVTHLSLAERGQRPIRLSQLMFVLKFLGIETDVFGLASCRLIPTRRRKNPDAEYLKTTPTYVYRHIASYEQFIQRRAPFWYEKLGTVSVDSYDALALIETLKTARVKQGDLVRETGLNRQAVRDVLCGRAQNDHHLLAVLRYAEVISG